MYDELVKRLREPCQYENCVLCQQAADAIEERDKYALSLQHEMMAEAESHIEAMGRLNKQVEELQKQVAYWQRELAKSMCEVTLRESEKPCWIPVTERLPKEDEEVLVVAVNDFDTYDRWAAVDWLYRGEWQQHSIVTHWMPLPEPPKEEA